MKKLFCFLAIIATFGLINIPSYATETPVYYGTFNTNQGAFYANGTPIVISEGGGIASGKIYGLNYAGSTIGKFYVGGETEDKSVTGIINKISTLLISSSIESLDPGTSNGSPITIYNKQKKEQKCETDFNCPTFFRFSTSKHLTQQSNC